mgnify:CR=1 FL=1
MPSPHTGENLAESLFDGLMSWHLEEKISTITVDNCSSNDGMLNILSDKLSRHALLDGKLLHMRCCAHILNLIVKDGMSIIENAIENIRHSVVFWSGSQSRVEKFENMVRSMKLSCTKKLALDVKTRWNSTYLMLETAIEYKNVFARLSLRDRNYKTLPSEREWELAKLVCDKLKIFFELTKLFSGTNYTTSNVYFVQVCNTRKLLCDWMASCDDIISDMATSMFEKFQKYWEEVGDVMTIAAILDPRLKLKVVEFYFKQIYGDIEYKGRVERVKNFFYDLLNEYAGSKNAKGLGSRESCTDSADNSSSISTLSVDLLNFLSTGDTVSHLISEFDYYITEGVIPYVDDFDILAWWKTGGIKFPNLRMVARDFLAIPVSTVASESAFSTGGRVVSLHRSRLHPDTLEALMCSRDWLWSELEGNYFILQKSSMKF